MELSSISKLYYLWTLAQNKKAHMLPSRDRGGGGGVKSKTSSEPPKLTVWEIRGKLKKKKTRSFQGLVGKGWRRAVAAYDFFL